MRVSRNRIFVGLFQLVVGLSLYACSDDEGSGTADSGAGASTSNGGAGGTAGAGVAGTAVSGGNGGTGLVSSSGGSSGSGNTGNLPVTACPGLPFDGSGGDGAAGACTGVEYEAERVDVDLFIMMDRSSSMSTKIEGTDTTRWQALSAAVADFAASPEAANIGAGIGFFSLSGVGNDDLDCSSADYAEPAVAIGPLSDVGDALVAAIEDTPPAGLTPTVPALEGAIAYAQDWADENPGRATMVVLVSDGYPTQCSGGPEGVAAAAKAGYESDQHIRTYVIGVGDVAGFNLDNYARSGGTSEAYLTDEVDVSATFVDAMLNITASDLACDYLIPEPADNSMEVDPTKVQVVYTPASGDPEEIPYLEGLGACAMAENGGWYYDNPTSPSKISVCPCTCTRFAAGAIDVRLGCKPRLGLR